MKNLFLITFLFSSLFVKSQTNPSFGSAIDVTINGLTFDAMEPFISADGNYLFFNNLNDGENTKLFYATWVNDSTFSFVGEVNGTNQPAPPQLDAVADMDSQNNFYWTSTRNYPEDLDNLFYGQFNAGSVTNTGRVRGNFNKNTPGWLVMDHGISYDGQFLYYNNARFDNINCQGPCETELGIAQKVNDSTFNKIPNSDLILQNIIDPNFIYYAPCISSDNLELYYTRFPRDTITTSTLFEVCVAVRDTPTGTFSVPTVLFSEFIADLIEAPTITTDKQILYYHKKVTGSHKIVMRSRNNTTSISTLPESKKTLTIYPNPTNGHININPEEKFQEIKTSVLTLLGEVLIITTNQQQIDLRKIPSGTYLLKIDIDGSVSTKKISKID